VARLPVLSSQRWQCSGHLLTLQADLTSGYQKTQYIYGVTTGGASGINSNDILSAVRHPDKSSGNPSSSEQDSQTVNALGQIVTATDRNGSVHTYSYDILGRVTSDAVTTLGSGVDGAVRRIETAYDAQGNAYLVTSYDAASAGNIVNQVQRTFNGLGQLKIEYQSHSGAVNTGTSPKVQYTWSEIPSQVNHSRLVSITYPNGKVLTFNYASGVNNNISRLSSISDTSGTLESYDYLGVDTVVRRAHSQPGVDLTYIKQSGESTGDAGDQYTGLDRFGRVVDQRWRKTSDGSHKDRFQYGYDRDDNRLWRDNLVNTAFGELYAYDNLNQLTSFQRGTLNGTKTGLTGSASRSQSWSLDSLGNFSTQTTDGTAQTRSHNQQNEITAVSGATTPTYDANGNLTTDETGKQFVYDAWNRLVTVKNSGGTTLESFAYDGHGWRVAVTASGTTTDLYYSSAWQVLEERVSGTATAQYVWSPIYVDALLLRDRDTDANGSLDERRWVQQDANFNVTALLDNSGNVVERYAYDSYGKFTIYDASWGTRSSSSFAWVYQHQGLRYDSTSGLYHARARDLSPSLGRWLQNDPAGFGAGDVDLYRAYGNGPTGGLDPSGLSWLSRRYEDFRRGLSDLGSGFAELPDAD
jgi:RHS repeat-associated protein